MNVPTALRQSAELLEKDNIAAPRLTAEVLLAHALGCTRVDLYARSERELTNIEQLHFGRYLHERLAGKPTQYITGRIEFYGREFRVTPAVFIPRPETELLVEAALRHAGGARRVLDVGTGSGCLAVTMQKEWPQAAVFACDLSRAALEVAQQNACAQGAPVRYFQADLLEACGGGRLDLVVSNPPYVPEEEAAGLPREVRDYEPHLALLAGPRGLDSYRRLLPAAARSLRSGGWLILELGYKSRADVESLLGAEWSDHIVERDLGGFDRVLVLRKR